MSRHSTKTTLTIQGGDMESNQARYLEIAAHVRALIGAAEPGDPLPSDADLCAQFDVSRMTARHAVELLVNEHLVERRRGKGTFVAPRRVQRALGSPLSFTENMRLRGLTASSRAIESGVASASQVEALALGISVGESVHIIERLRLADRIPMAIERVALPTSVAKTINLGLEGGSLHGAFLAAGFVPSRANANVSARLSTEWEQEQLKMATVAVVLVEERTIFDQNHNPLEHTVTLYAADRYSFLAVMYPSDSDDSK